MLRVCCDKIERDAVEYTALEKGENFFMREPGAFYSRCYIKNIHLSLVNNCLSEILLEIFLQDE